MNKRRRYKAKRRRRARRLYEDMKSLLMEKEPNLPKSYNYYDEMALVTPEMWNKVADLSHLKSDMKEVLRG